MHEQELQDLLQQADRIAAIPQPVHIDRQCLQKRARHRRSLRRASALGAALMLLLPLGLMKRQPSGPDLERVAHLETEVAQLRQDTKMLLTLVTDMVERQRGREQLAQIRQRLSRTSARVEGVQDWVNEAAQFMVQRADALWEQPDQRNAAQILYRQTIRLYPHSDAAQKARRRLEDLEQRKPQKYDKGADLWLRQNTRSSC